MVILILSFMRGCARAARPSVWPVFVTKKRSRHSSEYPRKNRRAEEGRDRGDAEASRGRRTFALGGQDTRLPARFCCRFAFSAAWKSGVDRGSEKSLSI